MVARRHRTSPETPHGRVADVTVHASSWAVLHVVYSTDYPRSTGHQRRSPINRHHVAQRLRKMVPDGDPAGLGGGGPGLLWREATGPAGVPPMRPPVAPVGGRRVQRGWAAGSSAAARNQDLSSDSGFSHSTLHGLGSLGGPAPWWGSSWAGAGGPGPLLGQRALGCRCRRAGPRSPFLRAPCHGATPRPGRPARGASQEKPRAARSRRRLLFLFHVKP